MRIAVQRELAPLAGATVVDAQAIEGDPGQIYPTLVLRCTDGKVRTLVIEQDPEGNGPGFARVEVMRG